MSCEVIVIRHSNGQPEFPALLPDLLFGRSDPSGAGGFRRCPFHLFGVFDAAHAR